MQRLAAAFLAFAALFAPAAHAAAPIESFTLSNGMEVVVIENHRVPAISHMLWFHVGAIDDPPMKSGLAHYHEHMMFQGTEHYAKGEFADIIAREGGEQNAFTGHDATAYYVTIAKEKLPLVMQLEADRLRGLAPKPGDPEKEREVIIEERRLRIENNPNALFGEQMNATLFQHHPYQIPVIGWMHEMEGLTAADVLDFHTRYYHPGNAILVVTGDITAAELKPLAEKYYGDIPAGPKVERHIASEPPHRAALRLTMHHPEVRQPLLSRSYIAPGEVWGETRYAMPLALLEQILGGGKASRLYQALVVKQKLASAVDANYDSIRLGPSEFDIGAHPADGVTPEKLEAAIDAEIKLLISKGVTESELARAKTLLKADTIYAREGLESMGYIVGWLRATGLPASYFNEWPKRVDAVTAEEVQAAAKAVLVDKESITGVLLPETEAKPDAR